MAEACAPNHNAVYAVSVKGFSGLGGSIDVSVADDGNAHAGVGFYCANKGPVCLTLVHLATGAAVDGNGGGTGVLETFGQLYDDFGTVVPAQAGLHGDWLVHRLRYCFGDGHHLVRLLHHSGTCAAAGNFAHRAAEVDVYYIGPVPSGKLLSPFGHLCRVHHCLRDAAVDLHRNRRFLFQGMHLGDGFGNVAYQAVTAHELRGDHGGAGLPAQDTERRVRHVLHGSQRHRFAAKIYVADFHC